MKLIRTLFLIGIYMPFFSVVAQEENNSLKLSGSVDTYYKYDLSGNPNIRTSFADEQNSISIGMIDIILEKTVGKSSFVGEVAFGPRNASAAGPETGAFAPRIQNLYVSHSLTSKITLTGGYMGTFVGYEVISPTGNFNYSTSYLFTNGPFQNAGIKVVYRLNEKVNVMAGAFNPWNVYTSPDSIGPSSFGAQLSFFPFERWEVYLNLITGGESGTELDLTSTFQLNDAIRLGLNAANYNNNLAGDFESSFAGVAIYFDYSISDKSAIGTRYEYFSKHTDVEINAFTFSGNLKGGGGLTLVPEIRIDRANSDLFLNKEGLASSSALQCLVAAIFAF